MASRGADGVSLSASEETPVVSDGFGDPSARTLDGWKKRGGYKALEKALSMTPEQVIDEVKASGLRGRGGAGFPTGVKWSFMKDDGKTHYLLINADESEPGAFKDRELMRWTPHQLLEGALIGAYAIRAQHVYIYIRGEFFEPAQILARAIEEIYTAGIAGPKVMGKGPAIDITLHLGAGAYICGEETALMNSLEGGAAIRASSRRSRRCRACSACRRRSTTSRRCASCRTSSNKGAAWYKAIGTEKSAGTKLFNVSGHVVRRGNYEFPLGFSFKELIYDVCGGIRDGRKLKAVIPGGSSVPILTADEIDIALDYESVVAAGSMLGTASVIVMDDQTCIVKQVRRMVEFYAHESCGSARRAARARPGRPGSCAGSRTGSARKTSWTR